MLIAANEIIISTRLTTRHDSSGCESRVRHITLPHVAQGQSQWQWQWHWHLLPLTALPLSWGYKPNICVGYTMWDSVCVCLCYKSFNWVISFPLQTSDSEASLYRATNKWGEKKPKANLIYFMFMLRGCGHHVMMPKSMLDLFFLVRYAPLEINLSMST